MSARHRGRSLLGLALVAAGCAKATPAARVSPPPPTAAEVVRDAAVVAVDAPSPVARFEGARVEFEQAWPRRNRPGMRFALVSGTPGFAPHELVVGWEEAPGQARVIPMLTIPETTRVQRMSVIDVTGDGDDDVVVWVDPASLPPEQVAHSTLVFVYGGLMGPVRAAWTSLALGVVADEAALRAAAPTLRSFVLPENAPSLDAVMLRLGFATAAQFRSLVAPGGLVVCDSATGNARPHYHRCHTYAAAAITDAVYAERIRGTITLFEDPQEPDDAPRVDSFERCRTVGVRGVCSVPTGGPATTLVVFTGPPAARRISRVETSVYEDS